MFNTFHQEMHERGFIKDQTFSEACLIGTPIVAYIGFDLTAPSLHVGSLIQLMVLRWLQTTGNDAIALLGGATTRIGDPSGKDATRKMLSDDEITANGGGIAKVISNIVPGVKIVNNDEWFGGTTPSFMDFLAEYGPHFTINRMMTFESVKSRLDRQQPLTFLEFCYMLLQAVDFRELRNRHGVNMQIGGSDQWGNIMNGLEIIRRKDGNVPSAFAMTTPLLLDREGNKMGKSQGKPIWLDATMTPVFDFFQYWRNCDDNDVERFLYMFTELARNDIVQALDKGINKAKSILAYQITKIVHGEDAAEDAATRAFNIFEAFNTDDLPVTQSFDRGSTIVEIIVALNGGSKSAARRLIIQNGVSMDDAKIVSEDATIDPGEHVIKLGKKLVFKVLTR